MTYKGCFQKLLVFVLFLASPGLFSGLAFSQEKVAMEAIARAWKKRQDYTKSASFSWVERETRPKGSLSKKFDRLSEVTLNAMNIKKGEIIPLLDSTFNLSVKFVIDGEKIRHDWETQEWSAKKKEMVIGTFNATFNGVGGKRLRKARFLAVHALAPGAFT